jgi:TIR domain
MQLSNWVNNMTDLFISYASEDRPIAERLADQLRLDYWEVFWDRTIPAGSLWSKEIQRNLRDARCVIVLWSATSKKSFWVKGEAAESFETNRYLPLLIDKAGPPRLFEHVQAISIARWVEQGETQELSAVRAAIRSRIGQLPMYGNLEEVAEGEPVTGSHLHLIHSCWRVDKHTSAGFMPYQIHLIIYGHRTALARVQSVEYQLPGYPNGHDQQPGGPRERLFELKELANGFSIAQAHVSLRSQPDGYSSILLLTRFINMSETGPRLADDFIRRAALGRAES